MANKSVFKTKYGYIEVQYNKKGLVKLELPVPKKPRICSQKTKNENALIKRLKKDLQGYFNGKQTRFNFPLDLTGYTKFQVKVWKALQKVPYGKVRSYKWLAERSGNKKSCRAVGNALGKNPLPVIIPCHRITLSNGRMGGFSSGIKWKKKLLGLEKAI